MPRKARNPGSGKAPHNGPARGAGYGGPAKGAGRDIPTIATAAPWQPGVKPQPGPWQARKAEIAAKAMGFWERVLDSEEEPTLNRMTAADKLADRVMGKPVQMVVTPDDAPSWFVIEGQAEAISDQAWEQQARLSLAKPAGNAD